MTYKNTYQAALSDGGIFVQQLGITSLKGLEWTSEAIHQYQAITGAARCVDIITLDPTSDDGEYDISSDIDIVERIEYFGVGVDSENESGGVPVNLVDYDYFIQNQQGYMLPANMGYSAPTAVLQSSTGNLLPSQFYATTYGKCKLFLFPFQGIAGQLKIWHKPYLLPYTPDAEGRWSTFGNPPDAQMAATHIPSEFNAAYEGIKSYVLARMIQMIPNHVRLFPNRYEDLMGRFNAGVELILRTNPPTGINNKTRPQIIRRIM
jgi:hypothetical protein